MNIITAIGNQEFNEKLSKIKKYNVLCQDIQYKEGIIEILEKNNNIDYLIFSSIIPGEYDLYELINLIKNKNEKIEIIIFLEKRDDNLIKFLMKNGIFNIFYNNQITIDEIIKILDKKEQENIIQEINLLKEEIFKNKKINKKEIILKIKNKLKINKIIDKKEKINNKKIITILGSSGVGKSIVASNLAIMSEKKKILLIDFDILNSSIHTIFGVKKYPKNINNINKKIKIENLIIKKSKKIDLICGLDLIFSKENKNDVLKIKEILNNLKNKYDLIIIDTSCECFFEYNKELINNSDNSIFIVEANLLELKKSKKLLEIYIKNWNIKKEKISILINKYNKNSIDESILKKMFSDFNIFGKIKMDYNYNLIINKNASIKFINKKTINEYKKLLNNL